MQKELIEMIYYSMLGIDLLEQINISSIYTRYCNYYTDSEAIAQMILNASQNVLLTCYAKATVSKSWRVYSTVTSER